MNSRQRIHAALNGEPADHTPLTTWCFGFPAPAAHRWTTDGEDRPCWYSQRLEHLHKLPHGWTVEDEFRRAAAWQAMGIDDILEVSVPWGQSDAVKYSDAVLPPGDPEGDSDYTVMVRTYETPAGVLRHAVRRTDDEGDGWPVQPDCVPIIEDYNIPRAVEHAVSRVEDIDAIAHLYAPPSEAEKKWFAQRMSAMQGHANRQDFFLQAWTAFGMDAAVWFTGTEGAVMTAMDDPAAFERLMQIIAETDYARSELAAACDGVDMICMRGWYSSTDFWSPTLFDRYVLPSIERIADLAHRHGKKFCYVVTTGIEYLGERLIAAGVDCLYFVDPLLDGLSAEEAAARFGGRITMVGGLNSQTLQSKNPEGIRTAVGDAMRHLAPTNRFILHPMDAIFPDTPFEGVQTMIEAWKEFPR